MEAVIELSETIDVEYAMDWIYAIAGLVWSGLRRGLRPGLESV